MIHQIFDLTTEIMELPSAKMGKAEGGALWESRGSREC